MRRPALYLRIAAVLTLFHAIGHTIGGVFASPPPNSVQAAAEAGMRAATFPVMGVARSYWDFHQGYGLFVAIALFTESVLFWQLAAFAREHRPVVRSLAAVFCISFLAFAAVAYRYFFLASALLELGIAACLAAASASAGAKNVAFEDRDSATETAESHFSSAPSL